MRTVKEKKLKVVLFCFLFRRSQLRFLTLLPFIGNDVCGFGKVVQGNRDIVL